MTQLSTRTTDVIAFEINSIKDQTRTLILNNSIEIGRRLEEAKSLLPHGEWGNWLKESVDYSQSTANNLMKIFEQYGASQLTIFGAEANSQALGNLSYTQAVALLGVPTEEREEFIKENDVENMSTRDLQKAIKEKQALEKQLKAATEQAERERLDREKVEQTLAEIQEQNQMNYQLAERYKEEIETAREDGDDGKAEELQTKLNHHQTELKEANAKVKELEKQLKDKPIDIPKIETIEKVVEKVPEEMLKELEQLREQVKRNDQKELSKFSALFEIFVKSYDNLLGTLYEIKTAVPDEHPKYVQAVSTTLSRMQDKAQ